MLILYDIDMTLLATDHIGIDLLRDAGDEAFGEGFCVEGIRFGGCLDPDIIARMLVQNQVEACAENIQLMRTGYARRLERYFETPNWSRALPGAIELVEATMRMESSPAIGVLTGNFQETGVLKLRAAGFDPDWFTVNAWGDGSSIWPPHRSHLPPVAMERYRALKGVEIEPGSVIVIGDTEHDVACARENGCRSLAVATGHDSRCTLQSAGADLVVDDLQETGELVEWIMNA